MPEPRNQPRDHQVHVGERWCKVHSSALCCREPQRVLLSGLRFLRWVAWLARLLKYLEATFGTLGNRGASSLSSKWICCWAWLQSQLESRVTGPLTDSQSSFLENFHFSSMHSGGRTSSAVLLRHPSPESSPFPHLSNLCPI